MKVSVFTCDLSQLFIELVKVSLCGFTFLSQLSQLLNLFVLVFNNVVKSFNFFCNHLHLVLVLVDSLIEFSEFTSHGFVVLTQLVHLLTFSVESLDFVGHLGHSRLISKNLLGHFIDILHSIFKAGCLSLEIFILVLKLLNVLVFFITLSDFRIGDHLKSFPFLA